jgi:hypothetical protein
LISREIVFHPQTLQTIKALPMDSVLKLTKDHKAISTNLITKALRTDLDLNTTKAQLVLSIPHLPAQDLKIALDSHQVQFKGSSDHNLIMDLTDHPHLHLNLKIVSLKILHRIKVLQMILAHLDNNLITGHPLLPLLLLQTLMVLHVLHLRAVTDSHHLLQLHHVTTQLLQTTS